MKKSEIVRRVVKDLMERDGVELTTIAARDVQARASSAHRQTISLPLIYMVLAQMKSRAAGGHGAGLQPPGVTALQGSGSAVGETDLLAAAAAFLRAAGTIENARRVLDQVEQFVAIVRDR